MVTYWQHLYDQLNTQEVSSQYQSLCSEMIFIADLQPSRLILCKKFITTDRDAETVANGNTLHIVDCHTLP